MPRSKDWIVVETALTPQELTALLRFYQGSRSAVVKAAVEYWMVQNCPIPPTAREIEEWTGFKYQRTDERLRRKPEQPTDVDIGDWNDQLEKAVREVESD